MKRITALEISNYRAFYNRYTIDLQNGENLLIYGENGSGKSSFFKSISNFLSSSQNISFPYVKHYNNAEEGLLSFTFNEIDGISNQVVSQFGEVINFGSDVVTTDTEQFLKTAELTKGFLDYKVLLKIYNHEHGQPNLFELIIETLLFNFIPIGSTQPLGKRFKHLREQIATAYTSVTWQYRNARDEMVTFESSLRNVLNQVFLQLNYFLMKYFKLNLRVGYSLTPLVSVDWWRDIPTKLTLNLKLNGITVLHQSDFLNEARLSALAICLYLSIIKRNPQQVELKVLFLDDVFIGLDLTNRLPILNIIKNEFSDYQIFISTYDRHLYELAKRKFETELPNKWRTIEFYVGKDRINDQFIEKPILIIGETYFEKGSQYLHEIIKPDYPASANYFRKALEQIIQEEIPSYEKRDIENKVQILDYKLGPLIYKTKRFLERLNRSTETVDRIITLLPSLLHPLSHHEIASPIYRGELLEIENLIPKFLTELRTLDISNNLKCSPLEGRNELIIKFTIDNTTGHFSYYHLRTIEPILLFKNNNGNIVISDVKCEIEKCYGENSGVEIQGSKKYFSNAEKSDPDNNFNSILQAYDKLHHKMTQFPTIGNFAKDANYLDAIKYLDELGNYNDINNVIVW